MNFNSMVARCQSLVGNHSLATSTVVGGFVNDRHEQLLNDSDWHRRKNAIIVLTATDKTAGTVTVTNASSTVNGAGTAFAAGDVGKSIRIGNDYVIYRVKAVAAQDITLGDLNGSTVTWPGTTAGTQSYILFSQFYSLGTAIEQIISVKYKTRLTETSQENLDRIDSARIGTDPYPIYFARAARDMAGTSDLVRIEIYPRPTTSVNLNIDIQRGHTTLSGTTNPIVPSDPLVWFSAVDTCFFLFAKTGSKDPKWMTLADKYEKHGMVSLEFALKEDAKQFGLQQTVHDAYGGVGLMDTDFGLTHDLGN